MSRTIAEKRAAFRALHASGCFVLPNPWDVGSARYLASRRLQGDRHDQFGLRVVDRPGRQSRGARDHPRAPARDGRRDRPAGQRRLRKRLRR